mgnify:CR=1 FL=1
MDEVSASKAAARGAQAEALLNSELFKEVCQTLREEYIGAWKITHYKETEGRERLWQAVQIVGKVEDHIKKIAANGRVASQDLARIRTNSK